MSVAFTWALYESQSPYNLSTKETPVLNFNAITPGSWSVPRVIGLRWIGGGVTDTKLWLNGTVADIFEEGETEPSLRVNLESRGFRFKYSYLTEYDPVQVNCKAATIGNLTGYAPTGIGQGNFENVDDTYDGITLSIGDRLLVRAQTDRSQNGVYQVSNVVQGATKRFKRTPDAVNVSRGGIVTVDEGAQAGKTFFMHASGTSSNFGSAVITWVDKTTPQVLEACRVATLTNLATTNVSGYLSAPPIVNNVTLNDADRVLVRAQNDPVQNGVYVVESLVDVGSITLVGSDLQPPLFSGSILNLVVKRGEYFRGRQFRRYVGSTGVAVAESTALHGTFSAKIAAETNINLNSPPSSIRGIGVTTGDHVAVILQTQPAQNGLYTVGTSAWERHVNFNSTSEIQPTIIYLDNKTASNADVLYMDRGTFDSEFFLGASPIRISTQFVAHQYKPCTNALLVKPANFNSIDRDEFVKLPSLNERVLYRSPYSNEVDNLYVVSLENPAINQRNLRRSKSYPNSAGTSYRLKDFVYFGEQAIYFMLPPYNSFIVGTDYWYFDEVTNPSETVIIVDRSDNWLSNPAALSGQFLLRDFYDKYGFWPNHDDKILLLAQYTQLDGLYKIDTVSADAKKFKFVRIDSGQNKKAYIVSHDYDFGWRRGTDTWYLLFDQNAGNQIIGTNPHRIFAARGNYDTIGSYPFIDTVKASLPNKAYIATGNVNIASPPATYQYLADNFAPSDGDTLLLTGQLLEEDNGIYVYRTQIKTYGLTVADDFAVKYPWGQVTLALNTSASLETYELHASQKWYPQATIGSNNQASIDLVSTSNVVITGLTSKIIDNTTVVDGYTVLLKGQTNNSQNNKLYTVKFPEQTPLLARADDFLDGQSMGTTTVQTTSGGQYAGTTWELYFKPGDIVGTASNEWINTATRKVFENCKVAHPDDIGDIASYNVPDTIDGVSIGFDDRVLLSNQVADPTTNGIYYRTPARLLNLNPALVLAPSTEVRFDTRASVSSGELYENTHWGITYASTSTFEYGTSEIYWVSQPASVNLESCRLATTADVDLSAAPDQVDGINVAAGDRILVKDQATSSENGVYSVVTVGSGSNGLWQRAADLDQNSELVPQLNTTIREGQTNFYQSYAVFLSTPNNGDGYAIASAPQTWIAAGGGGFATSPDSWANLPTTRASAILIGTSEASKTNEVITRKIGLSVYVPAGQDPGLVRNLQLMTEFKPIDE